MTLIFVPSRACASLFQRSLRETHLRLVAQSAANLTDVVSRARICCGDREREVRRLLVVAVVININIIVVVVWFVLSGKESSFYVAVAIVRRVVENEGFCCWR